MAREGILDFDEGQQSYAKALYEFQEARSANQGVSFNDYIREKVGLKAREFNRLVRDPSREHLEAARALKNDAEAYRKASDGE